MLTSFHYTFWHSFCVGIYFSDQYIFCDLQLIKPLPYTHQAVVKEVSVHI